jgi:probable rRNA maturation factor
LFHIDIGTEVARVPNELLEELTEIARWTLQRERARPVELSIALLSDESIAALNETHLAHPGPTDVISFPLEQPGAPLVGDVYVGYEQAGRQAAELGIELREELLRLVIHGTLHILGWDHPDTPDRTHSPMYQRQEELLSSFLERR